MTIHFATDCWFLTGPTASGKSAVGVELARQIGGEIISMDSIALYRGMDVGTAKPTASQRAAVAHHLIDVIEPHEELQPCGVRRRRRGRRPKSAPGAANRSSSAGRRCT